MSIDRPSRTQRVAQANRRIRTLQIVHVIGMVLRLAIVLLFAALVVYFVAGDPLRDRYGFMDAGWTAFGVVYVAILAATFICFILKGRIRRTLDGRTPDEDRGSAR